jgi:DNA-binding NarL/FixJ family response regulator
MRILIVDDHALIREGMSIMIRAVKPEAEIVQAISCQDGLDAASSSRFDLALLDLQLPDKPGFVALETLRREQPELPIVVISGVEDRATVIRALDAGAKAFVPKSADATKTQAAVDAVLSGRIYLPESLTEANGPTEARGTPPEDWDLTERQLEVLSLLVAGLSNKLIARRLGIAESTVKIHVSAVLRAFRVTSRTQALIMVARSGIRLPAV